DRRESTASESQDSSRPGGPTPSCCPGCRGLDERAKRTSHPSHLPDHPETVPNAGPGLRCHWLPSRRFAAPWVTVPQQTRRSPSWYCTNFTAPLDSCQEAPRAGGPLAPRAEEGRSTLLASRPRSESPFPRLIWHDPCHSIPASAATGLVSSARPTDAATAPAPNPQAAHPPEFVPA